MNTVAIRVVIIVLMYSDTIIVVVIIRLSFFRVPS